MTVTFLECGRGKKTWSGEIADASEANLRRVAKRHLMSNDIEFEFDADSLAEGEVVVGGFRAVGRFRIER